MTYFLALFRDNHLFSSKVLICALELSRSSGFPVLSITFSAWVFLENLLWALYVFLVTPKPIDCSTHLSPRKFPCSIEHNRRGRLTDWHAFWIAVIGLSSMCLGEQLAECHVIYVLVRWRSNVGEGTWRFVELAEGHEVGLITCEGGVDVVGVVTPLVRGDVQVLHGDQVVELSV